MLEITRVVAVQLVILHVLAVEAAKAAFHGIGHGLAGAVVPARGLAARCRDHGRPARR